MKKDFDKIIELYKSIPGISTKLAERLFVYTIENNKDINIVFEEILNISKRFKKDNDTGLIIPIDEKANESRNKEKLLIIQNNKDYSNLVDKFDLNESAFILDFERKDYSNTEKINNLINRLFLIIKEYNSKEILFLLTPSIETEILINVIKREIKNKNIDVNITKIGIGVPFGGSLEFVDKKTINEAIRRREKA